MSRRLAVLVLLCCAVPAWAHDLALTGQVSRTPATAESPATGSSTGILAGSWDINDDWSLDGSFGLTRPSLKGDPSVVKAGNVYALNLGPSWMPNDHWLLMAMGAFSPKSLQVTQTTLAFDDKTPPPGVKDHDAQVRAESSSGGLSLLASYDTAGESDWETTVLGAVNWNHYGTLQRIEDVTVGGQTVDKATLGKACTGKTDEACKMLTALLRAQSDTLDQVSVAVTVTEQIHKDWDAVLGGTYYLYSKDPATVGLFSIAARGTGTVGPRASGSGVEFGEGIALAALQFNSQVGAACHAHGWKVALNQAYGRYVNDSGSLAATTLKASYKFNAHWKLLGAVTFQRDLDSSGTSSNGGLGSLTLRYTWD